MTVRNDAYWAQTLLDVWPETRLDRHPLESRDVSIPDVHRFELSRQLSRQIARSARYSPQSMFAILVAALALVVRKYIAEDALTIGIPRTDGSSDADPPVLPLRLHVPAADTFKAHLTGTADRMRAAYDHQNCAFADVGRLLGRDLSDTSGWCHLAIGFGELHGQSMLSRAHPGVVIWIEMSDARLLGTIRYHRGRLSPSAVARLAVHYVNMLETALAHPSARVDTLSFLAAAEERHVVVDLNDTATRWQTEATVLDLLEAQANRTPDALAVSCGDQQLNYRELFDRVRRLGARLHTMGVSHETTVAVLLPRNVDWLTTILAIWKAGAAYLPLDPRQPPARMTRVLEQSRAPLALTTSCQHRALADAMRVPGCADVGAIYDVEHLLSLPDISNSVSTRGLFDRSLVYVIYTSGSTGLPKGAMIEESGMRNHLHAKVLDLRMSSTDVVAQSASAAFDVSIWQLMAPLLAGGVVRILSDDEVRDPCAQLEAVDRFGITLLEIVPSQLRVMIDAFRACADRRPTLGSLRRLIVNGEPFPPGLAREWFDIYPGVPLLNAYGPTECSDDVTHYALDVSPGADLLTLPVGRPLANLRVYVLDEDLRPLPIGVPGKLYIGGDGVGRGYLFDPVKTADNFRPDPFASGPGARLYKTGDIGRRREDGQLECLGRVDHQIKLRGVRIELGEIEAALREEPSVAEAVAAVNGNTPNEPQLVAYVVARAGLEFDAARVRDFLKTRLPDSMVPAAIVHLSAMPLTPNGKIDRRALPDPGFMSPRTYVPPRTPTEHALAGVWTALLQTPRVGIHDNFFDLGGHSLLAVQLVARVREAFGIELPLRRVFETPTIAELSEAIAEILVEAEHPDAMAQLLEHIDQLAS